MGLLTQPASSFNKAPAVVAPTASTAAQLTTSRTSGKSGVIVWAAPGNDTEIYFGTGAGVTDSAGWTAVISATHPSALIPISDASQLWYYTTGTGQKFGWSVI